MAGVSKDIIHFEWSLEREISYWQRKLIKIQGNECSLEMYVATDRIQLRIGITFCFKLVCQLSLTHSDGKLICRKSIFFYPDGKSIYFDVLYLSCLQEEFRRLTSLLGDNVLVVDIEVDKEIFDCLPVINYFTQLNVYMKKLPESYSSTIVTLLSLSSDTEERINAAVLSYGCRVLEQEVKDKLKCHDDSTKEVFISVDIEMTALRKIVYFFNSGDLTFSSSDSLENVCNVYTAAHRYQIPRLLEISRKALYWKLNSSNAFDLLQLADVHKDEEFKSLCFNCLKLHMGELYTNGGFQKIMVYKPAYALQLL